VTRLDSFLASGFSATQKSKVEYLAEAFLELDEREMGALARQLMGGLELRRTVSPTTVMPDLYLPAEIDDQGNPLDQSDDWKRESEALKALMTDEALLTLIGVEAGSLGRSGGNAPKQAETKVETEAPEPVKEEKKNFDVELTSFAPELKVKLIKELKDYLKLGLKDVRFGVT
jgi:hypothetical protein